MKVKRTRQVGTRATKDGTLRGALVTHHHCLGEIRARREAWPIKDAAAREEALVRRAIARRHRKSTKSNTKQRESK